jgi:elongation factor Ts
MAVSAADVKALRDVTGAGMMDCKNALTEADGDMEKAKDILRQRGQAKGAKREGRATAEGTLAVAHTPDLQQVVVLELNCETDFVGRSDDFRALAQQLADQALVSDAHAADGLAADEMIDEAVSRIGERIVIGRVFNWKVTDAGVVVPYLHTATRKVAVLVELGLDKLADEAGENLWDIGREVGMQVASMRPLCVGREDVPADVVERERNVLRQADDMANKPPQIQDKIIEGRLSKFYAEVCLLEQEYAREKGVSVRDYVKRAAKDAGVDVTVRRFERIEVGVG